MADIHNLPRPGNECARLECFLATKIPRGIHSSYRQSVIRQNGARNESRFEGKGKKISSIPDFSNRFDVEQSWEEIQNQTSKGWKVKQRGEEGEVTRKEINVSSWKSAGDGRITLEMEIRFEYFMKIFPDILS